MTASTAFTVLSFRQLGYLEFWTRHVDCDEMIIPITIVRQQKSKSHSCPQGSRQAYDRRADSQSLATVFEPVRDVAHDALQACRPGRIKQCEMSLIGHSARE